MPPMQAQGSSETVDESRDPLAEFEGRHPSTIHALKLFKYGHLANGELRDLAGLHAQLAFAVARRLPDGPELTAGLRKLCEAADCHVRALDIAAPNRPLGEGGDMPRYASRPSAQ